MIAFDASALARLAKLLAGTATVEAGAVVETGRTANDVADEARGIASGYPKGTGALAADVNVDSSGLEARVYTNQREGFYLEVGSPNTGPPRPWLTGPAGDSLDSLGDALAALGRLW